MSEQQIQLKPLLEYRALSYDKRIIKESIETNKPVILSGIFSVANTLNQNGRIYAKNILEREVNKYQELIEGNRAYGSLDHPETSIIELSNAAILIKELSWDNNTLIGKLEVLNTSKGKDAKAILEAGGSVGISSRAFGSTKRNSEGNEIVNDDLQLISFDLVATPSVAQAILSEGLKFKRDYKIDRKQVVNSILDDIIKNY